ncbi:DHH family phosphoesterase [Candidatus Woesearchaeota archaeon]|nr:DHH family phosphoesterase [Candidatus Woesearchaeota archaeon]
MVPEQMLEEFRQALLKAENPLFMFDNDIDGLSSYLLLKRFCKKGRPFIVKSSPQVNESFVGKISNYHADMIFILDKPIVEQEFIDNVSAKVYWIDHHPLQSEISGVKYLNPRKFNPEDYSPTSFWCYQIAKQDLWLAMCGIVGDWHIPNFFPEFKKQYPELVKRCKKPGDLLFKSPLGELIKMLGFLLKGKENDVRRNLYLLEKVNDPYEILKGTTKEGNRLNRYYQKINQHYALLLQDAVSTVKRGKILAYFYTEREHSFTGNLANELIYRYPKKVIIVGRKKNDRLIISLRSSSIKLGKIIGKIIHEFDGYGGGHDYACACNIPAEDIGRFLERIREETK